MPEDDLIVIARFGSPQEAHISCSALDAAGIRACVTDEASTSCLWHVGPALGGAKLQVARRDEHQAQEILAQRATTDEPAATAPGACPQCGAETETGFDVCWSCGSDLLRTPTGDADQPVGHRQTEQESIPAEAETNGTSGGPLAPAHADVARAWRSAVFGIVFPPVMLYAIYMIIKTSTQELDAADTRRFYAALLIVLVGIATWWTLVFELVPR